MASEHDIIRQRAGELRSLGLTKVRAFRLLKREFPQAERDVLVNAAQLPGHHKKALPSWAVRIGVDGKTYPNGGILHPVTVRRDPRKF